MCYIMVVLVNGHVISSAVEVVLSVKRTLILSLCSQNELSIKYLDSCVHVVL